MTEGLSAGAAGGALVNQTITTILKFTEKMAGSINTQVSVSTHSLPAGVTIPNDAKRSTKRSHFAHSTRYVVNVDQDKLGSLQYFSSKDKAKKYKKLHKTYTKILFSGDAAFEVHVTRAVGSDGRPHIEQLGAVPAASVDMPKMWTTDEKVVQAVAVWADDGSCTGIRLSFSMNHKGTMTHLSGTQSSSMTVWGDGRVTGGSGPAFTGVESTLTSTLPETPPSVVEALKRRRADQVKAKLERKDEEHDNVAALRKEYGPKIDNWLRPRGTIDGLWTAEARGRMYKDLSRGKLDLSKETIFAHIVEVTLDDRIEVATRSIEEWETEYRDSLGGRLSRNQEEHLATLRKHLDEATRQLCEAGQTDDEISKALGGRMERFVKLNSGGVTTALPKFGVANSAAEDSEDSEDDESESDDDVIVSEDSSSSDEDRLASVGSDKDD